MDDKEKKLLVNLVSTFLILLSACLLIALLIILKFQESCPEVIVGMLGVCATLYAPVAAFFFYDAWKAQHNATVYSNLALEALTNLKNLNYKLVSFADLENNLKVVTQNSILDKEKKKNAVINIYENYIDNRQELALAKSIFLHEITFISQFRNDTDILSLSLEMSNQVQKQLDKLNDYVKGLESMTLNNEVLLKFITEDNTKFVSIATINVKKILPLLQKYIQQ